MKTLEEVYYWVAIESGYPDKAAMFNEITGDEDLVEFYMRLVATKYAEQAIEECAESAEEMMYELPISKDTHGLVKRTWHTCYAVPKQTILKVKEELK